MNKSPRTKLEDELRHIQANEVTIQDIEYIHDRLDMLTAGMLEGNREIKRLVVHIFQEIEKLTPKRKDF